MRPRARGGAPRRRGVLSATLAVCLIGAVAGGLHSGECADAPSGGARCDCARFADELGAARALYASRGEGATVPPTAAAGDRFRERVLETYERARCLIACTAVAETDRDQARVLLATAAFKARSFGPNEEAASARIKLALDEMTRCLAHNPGPPACHLWNGSIRGVLAEGSWSPTQIKLPGQLLADFRAARAGAAPGSDPPNGAATRAEAALLMRAPRFTGGDVKAAVRLMEEATHSPLYPCTVDNRLVYAEALTRTSASLKALAELRAALAAGLPSCGDDRYENARDLGQAARCVARLEAHPADDPGWKDDCQ